MPTSDPLLSYKAKRNFAATPEPADSGAAQGSALSFVVQKHWASSLHYDFRLELGGTLRSWAVPKGPSFDPKVKRMAIQVEDHPLSYASFEGTIPEKLYGAGKVLVWDRGSWTPVGDPEQALTNGNLKFELNGRKLHGRWALVRMKGKSDKQPAWLLIKERDSFARAAADYSVVDELPDGVRLDTSTTAAPSEAVVRSDNAAATLKRKKQSAAQQTALPASLAPQLATLVEKPPAEASRWLCEIKFDGYRLLARVDLMGGLDGVGGADVQLFTRNGHNWTAKLPALHAELVRLKLPSAWYDGEIVLPDAHGVPDFGALQQAFEAKDTAAVVFYVFDMPYSEGEDLRALPLVQRRTRLQQALKNGTSDRLRLSEVFDGDMASVLSSACRLGLEGVIAKRRDSAYASGRSADWVKLKCGQRQEFVVGGYTDPRGARHGFGALLLGVQDDAKGACDADRSRPLLRYVGNVGAGFSDAALQSIRKKLDALARARSPFAESETIDGVNHWVNPRLVAEVSFGEWTHAGRLRHAVFRGLRTDKPASAITREHAFKEPLPIQAQEKPQGKSQAKSQGKSQAKAPESTEPGVTGAPPLSSKFQVSHPNRVIDASTGFTKIELVRYYALVGDLMMWHLRGRPVALLRAPQGIEGHLFFQRHADTHTVTGVRQLDAALNEQHPPMLEIANKQGLVSAAQWNVIEFHTLNGVAARFDHPDRMVFDLDPGEAVPWKQVQEAAELVAAFLLQLRLVPFLKTSGGKGLHVVVPLRKVHTWAVVKDFSHAVVLHMAHTIPQRFVEKSGLKNRLGKVFIDYLRNGEGASTACAWSARARPGLGISVPVAWEELGALKAGNHWTVQSVHSRLDSGNLPWKNYLRSARSLTAAMSALGFEQAELDN